MRVEMRCDNIIRKEAFNQRALPNMDCAFPSLYLKNCSML